VFGDLRGERNFDLITPEHPDVAPASQKAVGRLLALDLGTRRVGVAVCDELRLTVRPVEAIERRSWKDLLRRVAEQIEIQNACGLVIGFPLNLDGSEGDAADEARNIAEKFRLSIKLPVYLQDERLTTEEAKSRLRHLGSQHEIDRQVDSEAAAIILRDFISREHL
jgi:putative Holliday junction resolvase